jgi:hypothetical protein
MVRAPSWEGRGGLYPVLVFRQGVLVAAAQSVDGTETTPAFIAASGSEYIIVVTGFGTAVSYTTMVTIN